MTTSQRPIRTLIVDDEALSRRGLEIRLRTAGDFEVIGQCANGREAIDAVRSQQPDLVFLDIQMPGLSGFDVLEEIPLWGYIVAGSAVLTLAAIIWWVQRGRLARRTAPREPA